MSFGVCKNVLALAHVRYGQTLSDRGFCAGCPGSPLKGYEMRRLTNSCMGDTEAHVQRRGHGQKGPAKGGDQKVESHSHGQNSLSVMGRLKLELINVLCVHVVHVYVYV